MTDDLHDAVSELLAGVGLELVDIEQANGLLRVTVDREDGVDLDALSTANREVSRLLDRLDPFPGRYTLEVSSPGLERRLRTLPQFRRAVGQKVHVRLLPGCDEPRRLEGILTEVGTVDITLEVRDSDEGRAQVAFRDIERARTVFEWGPPPKGPTSAKGSRRGQRSAPRGAASAQGAASRQGVASKKGAASKQGGSKKTERANTP